MAAAMEKITCITLKYSVCCSGVPPGLTGPAAEQQLIGPGGISDLSMSNIYSPSSTFIHSFKLLY